MPVIGLKYCIAAKITSHVPGQMPVYENAVMVGRMMLADLSWNRVDVKQYSDDALSDSFNGITGGRLSIGVNDISQTAKTALGIDDAVAGQEETYATNLNQDGYEGIGIMRVMQTEGRITYVPQIFLQTRLGIESENARTKGENLEFQSPTMTGDIMPIAIDSTMKNRAEIHREFTDEEAAYRWLCTTMGYTTPTQSASASSH